MLSNYIDFNRKIDSIINDFSRPDSIYSRVVISALPLINLHQKGAIASFVLINSVQIITNSTDLVKSIFNKDYDTAKQKTYRLCFLVASVSASILMPNIQAIFSTTYFCVNSLNKFTNQLKNKELKLAFFTFLEITNELLHLASIYSCGLEILVISLLSKAIVEFSQGYVNQYKNGKTIEAFANCLMGVVRGYAAFSYSKQLYRNNYGKELTKEILLEILHDHKNVDFDFDKALENRGISSYINKLDFSIVHLTGVKFKYMKFTNCDFSKTIFKNSTFENTDVYNSSLIKAIFINSMFKNSFFFDCDFYNSAIINSKLYQTKFSKCSLNDSCWNNSFLEKVFFEKCSLNFSHFFNAKAVNCKLKEMASLVNCYLFETKKGFKIEGTQPSEELPVIAMEWDFEYSGELTHLIHRALEDNEVFPMRVEFIKSDVNIEILQKEVKEIITNKADCSISLPRQVLTLAPSNSEIGKIKLMASRIIETSDGLSIPGGFDVEPEFYGAERSNKTYTNPDYLKSIFEFCLISEAINKKKPAMGTCRGSQIINVFLGGTLKQHVDGHYKKIQDVELISNSSLSEKFKERLGEIFSSTSMHHQAADVMGEGLEAIYKYNNVVKLYTSKDELILGSQVHPETYLQNNQLEKNKEIYLIFKERINQSILSTC